MKKQELCRTGALIIRLQELVALHGDLPVCVRDDDTENQLAVGVVVNLDRDEYPTIEITGSYAGYPNGAISPSA